MRKANLEGCWRAGRKVSSSIRSSGEIGPDLFRAACRMGLEGLVSNRRDCPYQAGRSTLWLKVKNRKHPAIDRVMESMRLRTSGHAFVFDDGSVEIACPGAQELLHLR
jgi:bifunctional non-homologous end joining protein LigD